MSSLFRRISGAIARVGVLPLFVFFLGFVVSCQESNSNREGQFYGSLLDPPVPAADFALTNQKGQPFKMSSTRGSIVLMTFLYTHCTDACPYVALKMKEAMKILGDDAKKIKMVAVSSDPERDTVSEIAKYSDQMGLYDSWDYVTGSLAEMEKIWKDYHVTVDKSDLVKETPATASVSGLSDKKDSPQPAVSTLGLSDSDLRMASDVIKTFGGGYEVAHSVPFWLIDTNGNIVVSLGPDATPVELARDLRTVLNL